MKAASDVMLNKIIQRIKSLIDGKADADHTHTNVLTREKCDQHPSSETFDVWYTSKTNKPLFWVVTVVKSDAQTLHTQEDTAAYVTATFDWNICSKGSTVIVRTEFGDIHYSLDTNGIATFEFTPLTNTTGDAPESITRVDGYY